MVCLRKAFRKTIFHTKFSLRMTHMSNAQDSNTFIILHIMSEVKVLFWAFHRQPLLTSDVKKERDF